MKRGLKVHYSWKTSGVKRGHCNRYPDEKGTESTADNYANPKHQSRYNRYPDEKGTERTTLAQLQPLCWGLTGIYCGQLQPLPR